MYSATNLDRALQLAGDEWVRLTKATKTAGTITLTANSNVLPQAPPGWAPEFHLQHYLFLDGQVLWPDLQFVDYDEVLQAQCRGWIGNGGGQSIGTSNTFTGRPCIFGYRDISDGICAPIPDKPYEIQLWYWQLFTSWLPGIGLASVALAGTNSYLGSVSIADGGYYNSTPAVTVIDNGTGTGSLATVVATINSSGMISAMAITASGHNYSSPSLLINGISATDFVFNVPDDMVKVIASDGVAAFLQENEPENSGISAASLARFRDRAKQVASRGPSFRGGTVSYKDASGYGNYGPNSRSVSSFVPYYGAPYSPPQFP